PWNRVDWRRGPRGPALGSHAILSRGGAGEKGERTFGSRSFETEMVRDQFDFARARGTISTARPRRRPCPKRSARPPGTPCTSRPRRVEFGVEDSWLHEMRRERGVDASVLAELQSPLFEERLHDVKHRVLGPAHCELAVILAKHPVRGADRALGFL